ncbi:class I SAM-dependent DNA methyltransferase [Chryseobacterium sp. G0201]|uniref:HsdM family class I SAM-dependent methyltransferase n=1 Tax=Chryseobacterium sp. G0201 TaxID=2487065 RepID=UPI000F4DB0BA|nr:N-6 DNA methylase [Chryseobacterium sp. G0201]AZA54593.1 endonuclease [Chryseobacterium sp. G0201]
MKSHEIVTSIGLQRAISVDSEFNKLSESQVLVLDQIREFEVDAVYFNTDDAGNSFPAIFVKSVNLFDAKILREIAEAQRKIWNYKKVLFLYVYSEFELRIYNCSDKPLTITQNNFDEEKELQKIEIVRYVFSDSEKLDQLNRLFSMMAIDSGSIWTLEEAEFVRKKINIQKRVDKYLVESLVNTAKQLEDQGLEINLIHRLILRSLFLLYLEDRDATDEKFYSNIMKGAKSFFDILEDTTATYALFQKLDDHFNGNVFSMTDDENISVAQLQLIKKCFISGNDHTPQANLFVNWRLFDFSIIQIELLSEIYENFLFETDPELKKQTGTYYTPPTLVEFILNEQLPVNNGETDYELKILDPTCGSGIFLVESFKRLVKRYENHHKRKLTDFNELKKLLTEHIFGIELHPQAIKVAAFSLYLALVDNLNPKTIWQSKHYRLPNLINNPNDGALKEQGNNLFCRDTIEINPEIESIRFDLVVGNPPFGTDIKSESIRTYCDQHGFAKEMVLPFLHKAASFAPDGKIALIFNTKVLTNTGSNYQNFRRWLFNECYVEKVYNFSILRNAKKNFGGQLFGDATGPISIVYYQKLAPEDPSDKIIYVAPKTYIKSNIIEGLSIDFSDVKHLPREECRKDNTKIWKVAMWGGMSDWQLVERLSSSVYQDIESYNKNYNIQSAVGFQLLTQVKDKPKMSKILTRLPYLDTDLITKYYTPDTVLGNVRNSIKTAKAKDFYTKLYEVQNISQIDQLTSFRRLGDVDAFTNPHILLKKGLEMNTVCATYISKDCSFRDGVYGFYSNIDEVERLHTLMAYFNSSISTYFLFMTISSYGIEREQIMKGEYLSIPINLSKEEDDLIASTSRDIISKLKSKSFLYDYIEEQDIKIQIDFIDQIIFKSFDLTDNEIVVINDAIKFSIDLFHKQEKSHALYQVLQEQITLYSDIISTEINDLLDGQDLFANMTCYNISRYTSLIVTKLTFENVKKDICFSEEYIDDELRRLDNYLWERKSTNIYFRKKLNYKDGRDIFIIRPNQRRFWTQSMALEDASELILEILNGN